MADTFLYLLHVGTMSTLVLYSDVIYWKVSIRW